MIESIISRTDIILLPSEKDKLASLISILENFTRRHYQIPSPEQFRNDVLGIDKPGALALYYDQFNHLTGFTRVCRQVINPMNKPVIAYWGGTYYNQRVNPGFVAAKFGLAHAMKDKLAHPEDEFIYFAHTNTPSRYHFLNSFNRNIYPKMDARTPDYVLERAACLIEDNHWVAHTEHPMVIEHQVALANGTDPHFDKNNHLHQYYVSINPDYHLGNSLLVYLPLNLATIGMGIKQVVSTPSLL
ncbi:hypothetical protein Lbir_1208 [Legionella birminghamensis]|uniref:Uncharacterized protein n=1 Tax=Legionella birminghamensis TaxID=28083 RepID=A0A378I740_9GAMM|nr:hypothetical protein [Legionella birminghamensis]KTC72433.1 hypothetical protein Lbir_1208 [Legionella birminghamensis]STX30565.1 Uncharacterised protein [Legionella birminghamensis]